MVHVKVFKIKQVILKMLIWISIVVFSFLSISIILKFVNAESRTFAAGIVEKNIGYDMQKSENGLNISLLKRELGIEKKLNKIDVTKEKNMEIIVAEDEVFEEKKLEIENKYLEQSLIKNWDRPKRYVTTKTASGKVQVGNVFINNYSKLNLDLEKLSKVSDFKIDDNTNILIVHTHTSEAYSEVGQSVNFRTLDDGKNIVSAGNVLKENLLLKNFNVTHITTKHDTPSYNGAYEACLKSVKAEFEKKKYDIVIDVHRDALSGNLNFRPTAEINGENAAKLMFVIGTNASGLSHDNWEENLKLALLIQNTANEMYPGLFRDLNLAKYRYNQNVCDGALILEVGATGNTLDEVWNAMKYFSNVLAALKK